DYARVNEISLRLEQISPNVATGIYNQWGRVLYFMGDYEGAIVKSRRGLERAPDGIYARATLAAALAQLGRMDEARAEVGELLNRSRGSTVSAEVAAPKQRQRLLEDVDRLGDGLRKAGVPE